MKVRAVPKALAEVAVAATSRQQPGSLAVVMDLSLQKLAIAFIVFALLPCALQAAVLPEERSDAMYHRYEGGGMVIDGPSVLVRKNFADKVSVAANYYVDNVSSASIDVVTIKGASKYSEKRKEKSGDITYIEDDIVFNVGITDSSENDYDARSYRFDMNHTFFGDMTTVNAGFSLGDDEITSSEDDSLFETMNRRQYRIGVAQVLTKNILLNFNYESVIDEGYLQNPYRKILVTTLDKPPEGQHPPAPGLYTREPERYPNTRNSDALSLKLAYHLPWDGAFKTRLGYFTDSWGIDAYSVQFDYSHKLSDNLALDFRLRHYQQGDADFYANLFYNDTVTQNFAARDKELSEYSSQSVGVGASYETELNGFFDRFRLNLQYDYMYFDYDNFREVTPETEGLNGVDNEPLYSFDAYTLRLFFTIFY